MELFLFGWLLLMAAWLRSLCPHGLSFAEVLSHQTGGLWSIPTRRRLILSCIYLTLPAARTPSSPHRCRTSCFPPGLPTAEGSSIPPMPVALSRSTQSPPLEGKKKSSPRVTREWGIRFTHPTGVGSTFSPAT